MRADKALRIIGFLSVTALMIRGADYLSLSPDEVVHELSYRIPHVWGWTSIVCSIVYYIGFAMDSDRIKALGYWLCASVYFAFAAQIIPYAPTDGVRSMADHLINGLVLTTAAYYLMMKYEVTKASEKGRVKQID